LTKVLHGQDLAVAEELDRLLGLGPIPQDLVTGRAMHGKGRALWCVGEQLYKVQTVLHPAEQPLTLVERSLTSLRVRDWRFPNRVDLFSSLPGVLSGGRCSRSH
jgi:hypothetical protein